MPLRSRPWTSTRPVDKRVLLRYGVVALLFAALAAIDPLTSALIRWFNVQVAIGIVLIMAVTMGWSEAVRPHPWRLAILAAVPMFLALADRAFGIELLQDALVSVHPTERALILMGIGETLIPVALASGGTALLLAARAWQAPSTAAIGAVVGAASVALLARLESHLLMTAAVRYPDLRTLPATLSLSALDHILIVASVALIGVMALRKHRPAIIGLTLVAIAVLYHGWLSHYLLTVMLADL